MAQRVAAALAAGEPLVVEAGTGTGKTFAYLVPALLCGARVLISTGTRTLQDQLFAKDLPLVSAALGRPARVALLKGRANYLCRYRLTQIAIAGEQLPLVSAGRASRGQAMLKRIERWAHTTRRGDLAELRGLSDSHPVWAQVTSTRETCLGVRCAEIGRCHVALARREALDADIVIVNHHLLLADLALKEDGFGDLLGSADAVILDEAHQIPDLATQFFGSLISSRNVENLLQSVQREITSARLAIAGQAVREVQDALLRLRATCPSAVGRYPWTQLHTQLGEAAQALAQALQQLRATLTAADAQGPVAQLGERLTELALNLERIGAVGSEDGARTVEVGTRGVTLSVMPFDISERFRSLVTSRGGAWIFTSATLSVGEEFGHFTGRLGLGDTPTLRIDSPFD